MSGLSNDGKILSSCAKVSNNQVTVRRKLDIDKDVLDMAKLIVFKEVKYLLRYSSSYIVKAHFRACKDIFNKDNDPKPSFNYLKKSCF